MFKVDIDGNEMLMGIFSLSFGTRKIRDHWEDKGIFHLALGGLFVALGVATLIDSASAGYDPDAVDDEDEV